jgi:hypothetical protein
MACHFSPMFFFHQIIPPRFLIHARKYFRISLRIRREINEYVLSRTMRHPVTLDQTLKSRRFRNRIQKYFRVSIWGLGVIDWRKNRGSKISWHCLFNLVKSNLCFIGTFENLGDWNGDSLFEKWEHAIALWIGHWKIEDWSLECNIICWPIWMPMFQIAVPRPKGTRSCGDIFGPQTCWFGEITVLCMQLAIEKLGDNCARSVKTIALFLSTEYLD